MANRSSSRASRASSRAPGQRRPVSRVSIGGRAMLAAVVAFVVAVPPVAASAEDAATGPSAPQPPTVDAAPTALPSAEVDGLIIEVRAGRPPQHARDRATELSGGRARLGAHVGGDAQVLDLDRPLPVAEAERLAARLEREGLVAAATPNVRMSIAATPNDTHYGYQWSLRDRWDTTDTYGISAEAAWDITTGSQDVVVAVLDTGVLAHPDIAGRLLQGYDLIDGDADASDPGDACDGKPSSWHGTHVAGTIGASSDNDRGIAGVDHHARILPVRVLGPCSGSTATVAAGIRWAAGLSVTGLPANPAPADVINLSLGAATSCPTSLQTAIDEAVAAGSLVVAAAGNDGVDAAAFTPANCGDVVTVAATGPLGGRAPYSNFGAVVDVAAPGGDHELFSGYGTILSLGNSGVTSPDPDGMHYAFSEGTSMAAPHVAGVASLALSLDPTLTPAGLTTLLRGTATTFPATDLPCSSDPTVVHHCGAGIVNAASAVTALLPEPEPAPDPELLGDPPTAPSLTATAKVSAVDLTWTASAHGSGIARYDLHRTTGATCSVSSERVYTGGKVSYSDTAVTGGTTYRYCVVAVAGDGQASTLSNTASATPTTPPATPSWSTGATLRFDLEGSDIRLTWPRAEGTVDRYEVFRDGVRIASTTHRSALVTGLRVDQRYRLQVRAKNVSGSSPAIDRYVTPAGPFSDVPSSSGFRTDIAWLATAETTRGCGGDRFCPGASVTRQQMAAFLTRGLGLTETSGIRFSDVPAGSTFATDIDKLATARITLGCGGDRFCPGATVTRQQMAAFLTRGLGLTKTSGIRFSDVPAGTQAATDIDKLATAGITLGCGGDRFCPGGTVSRQQMAAFLRRGLTD